MPITLHDDLAYVKYYDYDSPSMPDTYLWIPTARYRLDKPSTVKRTRPLDLFANGTARTVLSNRSFVVERASCRATDGNNRKYTLYGTGSYIEPYPQTYNYSSPLSTVRDTCDTQTLLDIKDQKVNLTVSIAELGKTTDMVADLARDTFRFFRSLRKGDLKTLLRVMKEPRTRVNDDIASKWLKYQYGIIPTIMEVNGLSEFIHQKVKEGFITGKTTIKRDFFYTIQRNTARFKGANPRFGTYFRKNTFRYRVSSEGLRSPSQSGITNPAAFVYELIPYSFVLDWFIPVGDYLATLDALVGVEDLCVIRSDTLFQTDMNYYVPSWGGTVTNIKPGLSITYSKRTRRLAPTYALKPGFPRYEPHVSTTRMVSGIALLNNFLSQRGKS